MRIAVQVGGQQLTRFDIQGALVHTRRLDVGLPEQCDVCIGGKSGGDPRDDRVVERTKISGDRNHRVPVVGCTRDDQFVARFRCSATRHRQLGRAGRALGRRWEPLARHGDREVREHAYCDGHHGHERNRARRERRR